MASFASVFGGLKRLFGEKVPRPTRKDLEELGIPFKVPVGADAAFDYPRSRGVKAGDTRGYTGREELGGEALAVGDAAEFVYGNIALFLDSSWLAYAKYYPDRQTLEVGLLQPAECRGLLVSNFTPQEALQFALATSKGRYFWSHVFVRGPGTGRGKNRLTRKPVTWL